MPIPVPEEWRGDPPEMLVVGNGSFAAALAQVLTATQIGSDEIISLPEADEKGKDPRVLDDLQRVFFVVGPSNSAADALSVHDAVWKWVKRLTAAKDRHQIAIQFLFPFNADRVFQEALCVGLSLPDFDSETTGYGAYSMEDGLLALVRLAARICRKDFVTLQNRRNADGRRMALAFLQNAAMQSDYVRIREATIEVENAFCNKRHYLDLFCNSPRHPNGNSLRSLLDAIVTGSVTPSSQKEIAEELGKLLA